MKKANFDRKKQRKLRHKRITNKLKKSSNEKPRLVVTKTNAHIFVQLIDDSRGHTLAASSTPLLGLDNANVKNATLVGENIAEKAITLGIKDVAFDRGGNKYHGKIKALAEGARKGGLNF